MCFAATTLKCEHDKILSYLSAQAGNKQTQRVRSLEQSHTQNVSAHNLLFVYVLSAMSVKTVLNVPAFLS